MVLERERERERVTQTVMCFLCGIALHPTSFHARDAYTAHVKDVGVLQRPHYVCHSTRLFLAPVWMSLPFLYNSGPSLNASVYLKQTHQEYFMKVQVCYTVAWTNLDHDWFFSSKPDKKAWFSVGPGEGACFICKFFDTFTHVFTSKPHADVGCEFILEF